MTPNERRNMSPAEKAAQRERETQWLRKAALGGDAGWAALERLIDVYEDWMLKFCMGWPRSLSEAEAEDALQNLWVRVFENAALFRDEGGDPGAWVWKILRGLVVDTQRDKWRSRRNDLGDNDLHEEALAALASDHVPGPDVPSPQDIDDCVEQKLQLVKQRYPKEAETISLLSSYDWKGKDLAQYLGSKEAAARQFLRSVRLKFQPHFQPCWDLLTT